jgi:hypothetical protein
MNKKDKNEKISSYDKLQISLANKFINDSKVIAYDLDQIIVRSEIPVVKEFNKEFKTNHRWQEHGWNTMVKWLKDIGINDEEKITEIFSRYWLNPEILIKAPIVPSTFEFIKKMSEKGKKQLIITSRKPYFIESTMKWLDKNNILKYIPKENVFMNLDKKIEGIDHKKHVIHTYADLMIEDSFIQLEEIVIHLDKYKKDKTRIIWIPSGNDNRLKKPKSDRVVKFNKIKYLSLVAQSY